jgi:hypothetical protein
MPPLTETPREMFLHARHLQRPHSTPDLKFAETNRKIFSQRNTKKSMRQEFYLLTLEDLRPYNFEGVTIEMSRRGRKL